MTEMVNTLACGFLGLPFAPLIANTTITCNKATSIGTLV